MKQKSKILAIVLTISLIVTQFVLVPSLTFAEESPKKVPENILNEAKENRTPILWFDFENVESGSASVTDRISGIVATYGDQKKENSGPTQYLASIPVTDILTLDGKAFQPTGNRDLIMPYEPFSQTGDEATIQAWVRMAEIHDYNALFWATAVKGDTRDIQQSNFIGIFPRRGDTKSYAFITADKATGGDGGLPRLLQMKMFSRSLAFGTF